MDDPTIESEGDKKIKEALNAIINDPKFDKLTDPEMRSLVVAYEVAGFIARDSMRSKFDGGSKDKMAVGKYESPGLANDIAIGVQIHLEKLLRNGGVDVDKIKKNPEEQNN